MFIFIIINKIILIMKTTDIKYYIKTNYEYREVSKNDANIFMSSNRNVQCTKEWESYQANNNIHEVVYVLTTDNY